MTGEPFSVRSGVFTSNFSHQSRADAGRRHSRPPNLKTVPGVIGPVVFTDASAFAFPAPGQDGIGRNVFTGPGFWNLDLGLTKNFNLTERMRMQLRAEAFNALNHPNFDTPVNATVGLAEHSGHHCSGRPAARR